jgi:hypothetical protein
MSGVLHPVGPEPARTYWIRRGVLVAVAIMLAVLVVLAVTSLTKAAVATAPPPVIPPVETSPTPSPQSSTPGPTSVPATSTSPARSPAPGPTTSTIARATPSAEPSITPSVEPSATTSGSPSPRTIGTPDCRPNDLRVTLKGDRTLSPGQNVTYRLSLINGSGQTCLASVTDTNFELKIYSGNDRIWSSRDCTKALQDFDKLLAAQADVDWMMTWNGERSVKGEKCQQGSEPPRSGTYWATAQLAGAQPIQLRMIIR